MANTRFSELPATTTLDDADVLPVSTSGGASRKVAVSDLKTEVLTGVAMLDVVDAKGDLLVGTAADTLARLAVGTDGYSTVANSNESVGIGWAPSARYPFTKYRSGRYYAPPYVSAGNGDPGFVEGRCYLIAFPVYRRQAFDRIGFWLVGAYGANTVARLGIFATNDDMTIGVVKADAGTIAISSGAGSWKEATVTVTLDPGVVYLAFAFQGGGSLGSGSMQRVQQGTLGATGRATGDATLADANHGYISGVTGAFADNPTLVPGDINVPLLKLRAV